MTLAELSKYFHLNKKLEKYQETLNALQSAATSVTTKLTGMPHAQGGDKVSAFAVQIVGLKESIEQIEMDMLEEKNKLTCYINTIEDPYIRAIYSLRFLECMTWQEIADAVGGGNTDASVKMACYRTLRKTEN